MTNINIIGYGVMGKQIAGLFYNFGCGVHIYTRSSHPKREFDRNVKRIRRSLKTDESGTVRFYDDISALPNNVTIETIVEDIEQKKQIYNSVNNSNSNLYFTNSSSYSPTEIGNEVFGLHFFNPIDLKLVELYVPKQKISEETKFPIGLLERFGYNVVRVNENRGYIGNYILFHEISSVLKIIENYCYPIEDINTVYKELYVGRNIFTVIDVIGVDTVLQILKNLKEQDPSIFLPNSLSVAIERNILGKKNRTSITTVLEDLSSRRIGANA